MVHNQIRDNFIIILIICDLRCFKARFMQFGDILLVINFWH